MKLLKPELGFGREGHVNRSVKRYCQLTDSALHGYCQLTYSPSARSHSINRAQIDSNFTNFHKHFQNEEEVVVALAVGEEEGRAQAFQASQGL
jgi:hypothetical protein